jgi:hypothetical protein
VIKPKKNLVNCGPKKSAKNTRALLLIVRHSGLIGFLLTILGLVLIPFFIGIPILVIGLLFQVFSFYRKWFIRLLPASLRQIISDNLIKSYQPYQPALHSFKNILWEIGKITAITLSILLVIFLSFIYFSYAKQKGYWECNKNNKWTKHGLPDYPAPVISCPNSNSLPQDKASCLAQGGIWSQQGLAAKATCNRKAVDQGNMCRDNAECEGWCQVELTNNELKQGMSGQVQTSKQYGQCSTWVLRVGCFGMLEKGKIKTICID